METSNKELTSQHLMETLHSKVLKMAIRALCSLFLLCICSYRHLSLSSSASWSLCLSPPLSSPHPHSPGKLQPHHPHQLPFTVALIITTLITPTFSSPLPPPLSKETIIPSTTHPNFFTTDLTTIIPITSNFQYKQLLSSPSSSTPLPP